MTATTVICGWCDRPATAEIETSPARFKPGRTITDPETGKRYREKILVQRAVTAPACATHVEIQRAPPRPQSRGRGKPGPEQTTIFDVPGV